MGVITFPPQQVPRPRKGDVLFGDLGSHNVASVNQRFGVDSDFIYLGAYRRAAELLIQHALENGANQYSLVYPIIFLFQHHLELALKRIIRRSPKLLDHELTSKERENLRSHRLDLLWQDLRPMIAEIFESVTWDPPALADLEGVDDYIRQLSRVDPRFFGFRYPFSNQGEPLLSGGLKGIDLQHFKEMVDRLVQYLDEIDTATSIVKEWHDDLEAEFGQDYSY